MMVKWSIFTRPCITHCSRRPSIWTVDGRYKGIDQNVHQMYDRPPGLSARQQAGRSAGVTASIPGADEAAFMTAANNAKAGCPISKVLKAEITMDAKLEN